MDSQRGGGGDGRGQKGNVCVRAWVGGRGRRREAQTRRRDIFGNLFYAIKHRKANLLQI